MSTDTLPASDAEEQQGEHVVLLEPAERGSLTIADKVVEKVAARAVTEVDLATGAPRTVLGQRLGSADPDRPARAVARVDGRVVSVSVTLAVLWPAPVRQVAAQVREHLISRIGDLTGLEVAEVDVDVPALVTARSPAPRVR